jgi:hypothetical protein
LELGSIRLESKDVDALDVVCNENNRERFVHMNGEDIVWAGVPNVELIRMCIPTQ